MNIIIGRAGYAFFDVWSIAHFCFWVFAGSSLWGLKVSRWWMMAGCLLVAYAWEAFERYAEKKWPSIWLNPETWWNAYISDPLTVIVGCLFIWYALDNWRG